MDISVVIPVYGCPQAVKPLTERLVAAIEPITPSFEIILVNDACPKGSWAEIEKVCEKDERIVGVNLSKNHGQIRAITAGLDYSSGKWAVVMDCDLQDRPESIPDLYAKAQEGYDVVFAMRKERKDSFITKLLSRCFYKVYDYFTDGCFDPNICNFSIVSRRVIDAYLAMREQHRAYTMLIRWLGYPQTAIALQADARYEGKSSYNLKRKLKLAADIIVSQSNKPLYFSIGIGLFFAMTSFLYILFLVARRLIVGDILVGWTSMIASIFLVGGLLLFAIGVVGLYIGNIFDESKHRPLYHVMDCVNGDIARFDKKQEG